MEFNVSLIIRIEVEHLFFPYVHCLARQVCNTQLQNEQVLAGILLSVPLELWKLYSLEYDVHNTM